MANNKKNSTFAALFSASALRTVHNILIMSKNLVIVESPAKAKTIEKFLGTDFHVLSSQGHIRDIEGVGKNSIGIDFANGYAPHYAIDPQKQHLIDTLKKAADKADVVWLASDEDREGEAIAWHLKEVLKLQSERTHRIVFHEITKNAIQEAIQHPRTIDYNLVNAQQARRVIDRIVGFELSPILWRKVTTGLSAGRVQSVAVRLIVEKEREIENFHTTAQYRVTADFVGQNQYGEPVQLSTELNHRFATKDEAFAFLQLCQHANYTLSSITHKPGHRTPAPPFTTSLLQQEASRKLHFPVSKTMRLAQSLYEAGKITYMRTDSVHLSTLAINTAKEEIIREFGDKYHHARQFKTSSKGAQEAHEAIRPTYMDVKTAGANNDEKRLYELIRKRALASQMADALTDTTRIEVTMTESPYIWVASTESIVFDGFMRVYAQSSDDEQSEPISVLPDLREGQQLSFGTVTAQESFTKQPQRYTEASLVKRMEELGIGRPSTYATVIETIQSRKYVEHGNVQGTKRNYNVMILNGSGISDQEKTEQVGADSGKLLPTDLGRITTDFLVEQFPQILSYDFTAHEEENFDSIAEGKADWVATVDQFYQTFHPLIEHIPSGKMAARTLGTDPNTGEPVLARISKNGPCVQIGNSDDKKPRFASLKKGQSIFTITLDEALELFQSALPYTLCQYNGQDVVVGEGKYGPYLRIDKVFVSIPKSIDPHKITENEAVTLIEQKQKVQEPIHVFGDIQVLNGRYGAYIKAPNGNYKIPAGVQADTLTAEMCHQIITTTQPTGTTKRTFGRKKGK